MKFSWEKYLGNRPIAYADKILKETGQYHPPICEKAILDFLKIEFQEITADGYPNPENMRHILQTSCAWLKKSNGKTYIYVYKYVMNERKRLGIVHECGHSVLPGHDELDYACSDEDIQLPLRKRAEQEAFECGSALLMPIGLFRDDIRSIPVGISAIERLRLRYEVSLEATAIWYASKHPGRVAMLMIGPNEQQGIGDVNVPSKSNPQFLFPLALREKPVNEKIHPLRVKYAVHSKKFPKFIAPGHTDCPR